ncbi:MAG: hypothetical protein WCX65_02830 [bacterium]
MRPAPCRRDNKSRFVFLLTVLPALAAVALAAALLLFARPALAEDDDSVELRYKYEKGVETAYTLKASGETSFEGKIDIETYGGAYSNFKPKEFKYDFKPKIDIYMVESVFDADDSGADIDLYFDRFNVYWVQSSYQLASKDPVMVTYSQFGRISDMDNPFKVTAADVAASGSGIGTPKQMKERTRKALLYNFGPEKLLPIVHPMLPEKKVRAGYKWNQNLPILSEFGQYMGDKGVVAEYTFEGIEYYDGANCAKITVAVNSDLGGTVVKSYNTTSRLEKLQVEFEGAIYFDIDAGAVAGMDFKTFQDIFLSLSYTEDYSYATVEMIQEIFQTFDLSGEFIRKRQGSGNNTRGN